MNEYSIGDRVTYCPDGWGFGSAPESGVVAGFVERPYGPRVIVKIDGMPGDPWELDAYYLEEE